MRRASAPADGPFYRSASDEASVEPHRLDLAATRPGLAPIAKAVHAAQNQHMDVRVEDLESLPLQRRMELVEALWASIAADLEQLPLSPELQAELRRRSAEHLRDPGSAIDSPDLRRRLDPER